LRFRARRITVNLAPADLPKEGSHYDLPIALGLMAAIGALPTDALAGFTVLGELGLDESPQLPAYCRPRSVPMPVVKGLFAPPPAGRKPLGRARIWRSSRLRH
jgi:magnesium chelatase family protein